MPRGPDMRFSIRHETHYRYSAPVAFAEHVLRLTPRADNATLASRTLIIDPEPRLRQESTDRYGNILTRVEFGGPSGHLRIESCFEIDTRAVAAPAHPAPLLPWPSDANGEIADYLPAEEQHESVRSFAAAVASESGWDVHNFLERLNGALFARMNRHIRPSGAAQSPEHTLATCKGACRDITMLFIAACRSLGVAARFVSGYQAYAETPDGRRHLHAWPEVFLPSFGWRGFDPTHGLPVTDGHVALCVAPDQGATMPVEGGFFGEGVNSTLDYDVQIAIQP
jgi:transglutaminase-like putative cysteine protease